MHVHANQFDPNLELNALYAAAKTEANKEAERTRKKLTNAASALAGEYEESADCVVHLGAKDESEEAAGEDEQQDQETPEKSPQQASSESVPSAFTDPLADPFSDWA